MQSTQASNITSFIKFIRFFDLQDVVFKWRIVHKSYSLLKVNKVYLPLAHINIQSHYLWLNSLKHVKMNNAYCPPQLKSSTSEPFIRLSWKGYSKALWKQKKLVAPQTKSNSRQFKLSIIKQSNQHREFPLSSFFWVCPEPKRR